MQGRKVPPGGVSRAPSECCQVGGYGSMLAGGANNCREILYLTLSKEQIMIFVESLIFEKSFFACFAFPFLPPFTVGPLWCFVILFLLCQPFRCLSVCRGCSSTPLIGFLLSSLLNYSLSNNIHTSTDGNHRQLEWQRMTEAVCVCVCLC